MRVGTEMEKRGNAIRERFSESQKQKMLEFPLGWRIIGVSSPSESNDTVRSGLVQGSKAKVSRKRRTVIVVAARVLFMCMLWCSWSHGRQM